MATKDLVQWDNSWSAQLKQVRARWIALLACLVLVAASVGVPPDHRQPDRRSVGAFATATASGYLLITAIVAVLLTSMRT